MEVAETNSNGVDAGHYPGWHQSVSPQALGQSWDWRVIVNFILNTFLTQPLTVVMGM